MPETSDEKTIPPWAIEVDLSGATRLQADEVRRIQCAHKGMYHQFLRSCPDNAEARSAREFLRHSAVSAIRSILSPDSENPQPVLFRGPVPAPVDPIRFGPDVPMPAGEELQDQMFEHGELAPPPPVDEGEQPGMQFMLPHVPGDRGEIVFRVHNKSAEPEAGIG